MLCLRDSKGGTGDGNASPVEDRVCSRVRRPHRRGLPCARRLSVCGKFDIATFEPRGVRRQQLRLGSVLRGHHCPLRTPLFQRAPGSKGSRFRRRQAATPPPLKQCRLRRFRTPVFRFSVSSSWAAHSLPAGSSCGDASSARTSVGTSLARQPLDKGVEVAHPVVRGGSLSAARDLGEVEPCDPAARIRLDRVAVRTERSFAVTQAR